jgi:putative membrane protein
MPVHRMHEERSMLRHISKLLLAGGCALLAANGYAQQTGNPAGLSPDTPGKEMGQPTPEGSNVQDKLFVRQAALGGQAEVELGKMAQKKASNESVREFAGHMVKAHTDSNQQLLRLGRGLNPELPKELDPEHQTVRNELQKASAKDFDLAYISAQIQDHQRTANLLQWHISTGQNEALKKYSMTTLPVVMDHLEQAKSQFAMLTQGAGSAR